MSKHNAPSVVYPLGRSRLQGQLLLLVWLLGAAAVALWVAHSPLFGWQQALWLAVVAVAGFGAWAGWKNSPVGQLAWDGQHWRWHSKGYQSSTSDFSLSVTCDFQLLMLLRIENQAGAKLWLWAERGALSERWLDLRRAVYSPQRSLGDTANSPTTHPV